MNAVQKTAQTLAGLERGLAECVEDYAALLHQLPRDRNKAELNDTWGKVASARRKLAQFLKSQGNAPFSEGRPGRNEKKLAAALTAAQSRLRLWGRFEPLMQEQVGAPKRKLIEATQGRDSDLVVVDHVIAMFFDVVHNVANPEAHLLSDTASKQGHHRDIPFPMASYCKVIGAAYRVCLAQRREGPIRFLDVGSGGGSKVLAATTCFEHCAGLEYEANAVETGTALLNWLAPGRCELIHADGLKYENYGDFDVIYYFRPIANSERMSDLEDRIIAQAKPGTILAVASGLADPARQGDRVKRLAEQVYAVGISDREAQELLENAEEMGVTVPGYGRRTLPDLGYWEPLQRAFAQNGYHL